MAAGFREEPRQAGEPLRRQLHRLTAPEHSDEVDPENETVG